MPTANVGQRPSYIGVSVPRLEDDRLLAGRARFLADMRLHGMLEMALVRSAFPHATIEHIDATAALAAPGVEAVVSAADLTDLSPVPDFFGWARPVRTFPLARDIVRYVGAPLAAVVAANRYLAEDAAELIDVGYDELPAVATIEAALAADAPLLYPEWPDNVMVDLPGNDDVGRIFENADRTVTGRFSTQRQSAVPLETRGTLAVWEDGRFTVWTTTQFPHICRTIMSHVLSVPEHAIRVIAPDIGGGFGSKAEIYPEDFLVCWLARKLGRPVRYVEDRAEHLVATGHARDMVIDLEAAVDARGNVLALRGTLMQDLGSEEIYPPGFNMGLVARGTLTGPYRIPQQDVRVLGVVTNKTPAVAFRGFGIPEAAFAMERLLDRIAAAYGLEREEVRRRNLLDPEDLPYTSATGALFDSGSHRAAFDRVVDMGRAALEKARRLQDPLSSTRLGLGVASYVEGVTPTFFGTTGNFTANESCSIRFEPDGTVTVRSGVLTMGQGVDTMAATLTAELLGLRIEDVRADLGDTAASPYGLGAWGSRSTSSFGGAVTRAADVVRQKGRRIAAHLLEVEPEDVALEDGVFRVLGTDRGVAWPEVAQVAILRTFQLPAGVEPGLEATAGWAPNVDHVPRPDGTMNACANYTNASHAAVVRVDTETGVIHVLEYLVVHDCGTVINPMIVEGQIAGGVAQGIGGTLYEQNAYGPDAQPLATSFMDYLLPSATDIPPMRIEHFESPAPGTAFGAKGAGEAGVIGPAPAIAAAVEDALRDFGVRGLDATLLTPPGVLRAIRSGERASRTS